MQLGFLKFYLSQRITPKSLKMERGEGVAVIISL